MLGVLVFYLQPPAMLFCSIVTVLIYGCTPFWNFLAVLFIYWLFFRFPFLLPYFPNRSGMCISFSIFFLSNLYMSSALSFFFFLRYHRSFIPFCDFLLFPPASRGPRGPSLHNLIFTSTGGSSAFFKCCWIFFMRSCFCLMLDLFEPISIFLVS